MLDSIIKLIQIISLYFLYLGMGSLVISIIFVYLNRLLKQNWIFKVSDFFTIATVGAFVIWFMIASIVILLASLVIINKIFFILFKVFFIESVSSYLSVTISLILFAYIPHFIGYYLLKLVDKIERNSIVFSELFRKYIEFLRIKIWVYLFAFILALLAGIEKFSGTIIIVNEEWVQVSSYVFEAVVTFLAFDTLIGLIDSSKKSFLEDISVFRYLYKEIRRKSRE